MLFLLQLNGWLLDPPVSCSVQEDRARTGGARAAGVGARAVPACRAHLIMKYS